MSEDNTDRTPGSYAAEKPATPRRSAPRLLRTRRDKIAEEIARNRRGEHRVPTWVLAVVLLAILAAYATVLIFS